MWQRNETTNPKQKRHPTRRRCQPASATQLQPQPPSTVPVAGLDVRHQMKNLDYRFSDSWSCGISRVRGGLARFGMAARNMPVTCGVKLARRIDAGTLPQQGLKATALPGRAVIQRLAPLGNVLDVKPLLDKVEQAVAGQPAFGS